MHREWQGGVLWLQAWGEAPGCEESKAADALKDTVKAAQDAAKDMPSVAGLADAAKGQVCIYAAAGDLGLRLRQQREQQTEL